MSEPTREQKLKAARNAIDRLLCVDRVDGNLSIDDYSVELAALYEIVRELEAGGWRPYAGFFIAIDITGQEGEAERVYGAIEKLLHEMGEVGTLSRCMRVCPPTTSGGEG